MLVAKLTLDIGGLLMGGTLMLQPSCSFEGECSRELIIGIRHHSLSAPAKAKIGLHVDLSCG